MDSYRTPETALRIVPGGPTATDTETEGKTLSDRLQRLSEASLAPATRRAFQSDWCQFTAWCKRHGHVSLPAAPETVALYLADHAGLYKVSTLQRRLWAVSQAHKAARLASPTADPSVRRVFAGVRREQGTAQGAKAPILTDDLREMVAALPATARGQRDRLMLLLGFAGAFRRSELVALNLADVRITAQGLVVTVRKSKTDQEGKGRRVGIPPGKEEATCPVAALQAWQETLRAVGVKSGALFRYVDRHGNITQTRSSGYCVARVVKRAVLATGRDPALYAGHSLRAGLATAAAIGGASDRAIMRATGHKSRKMLDRYIRDAELFRDSAATSAGL
jgi:integrase